MKINIQFEASDLQVLLQEYFRGAGFEPLNLEYVLESFSDAFPDGLHVSVTAADNQEEPPDVGYDDGFIEQDTDTGPTDVDDGGDPPTKAEVVPISSKKNPKLSVNDILTPSDSDETEMQRIIRESKSLEKE